MASLNNPPQLDETDAEIEAIRAVTDNLPNDGALSDILSETDKIDTTTTDGLTGVVNSLAYRVGEIERHLHSGARWFETADTPEGEFHVADRIGLGTGAFRIDAGDDTWGDWVQILGSQDTPTVEGKVYFDPHQVIVENTERAATYFIQIARGSSGDAGYAAGTYTETIYSATVQKDTGVIMLQTGRAPAGSKLGLGVCAQEKILRG